MKMTVGNPWSLRNDAGAEDARQRIVAGGKRAIMVEADPARATYKMV